MMIVLRRCDDLVERLLDVVYIHFHLLVLPFSRLSLQDRAGTSWSSVFSLIGHAAIPIPILVRSDVGAWTRKMCS